MFELGQTVVTRMINERIANDTNLSKFIVESLRKYSSCNWGDTCEDDSEMNDSALKNGDDRIVALFKFGEEKIFIITEWDRSVTTIMFAEEY